MCTCIITVTGSFNQYSESCQLSSFSLQWPLYICGILSSLLTELNQIQLSKLECACVVVYSGPPLFLFAILFGFARF